MLMAMDDHSHCEMCFKRNCNKGCQMMSCGLLCNATFHWCKQSEHEKLCQNARVPCINQANGCPHVMMRHKIGRHLSKCPASIISCTSQWNRAPLHDKECSIIPQCPPDQFGPPDLALLLRDQRCVNQGMNDQTGNPRQSIHPQPVVFPDCDPAILRCCDDANLLSDHFSPVKSISLSSIKSSSSVTDACLDRHDLCEQPDDLNDNDNSSGIECSPLIQHESLLSLDLTIDSICHHCQLGYMNTPTVYKFLCAQVLRRDEFAAHVENIHTDIYSGLNGWLEQRCPLTCYGCTFSIRRMLPEIPGAKLIYSQLLESFGLQLDLSNGPESRLYISGCDQSDLTPITNTIQNLDNDNNLNHQLECDSAVLNITGLDGAATSQCDILCDKPAVSDIQCGICDHRDAVPQVGILDSDNNDYGTDISASSLHAVGMHCEVCEPINIEPDRADLELRQGAYVDDVCVSDSHQPVCEPSNTRPDLADLELRKAVPVNDKPVPDNHQVTCSAFTSLPVEVLERIAVYLDGFSLNNLALTAPLLRDMCCNLLHEKGIVIQRWSSQLIDGKMHWFVADNLWKFSNAMPSIYKWRLNEEVFKMQEHLQACTFNTKMENTEPVCVMFTNDLPEEKTQSQIEELLLTLERPLHSEYVESEEDELYLGNGEIHSEDDTLYSNDDLSNSDDELLEIPNKRRQPLENASLPVVDESIEVDARQLQDEEQSQVLHN